MAVDIPSLHDEAQQALERVQAFDPERLVRRDELGKYAFTEAVEPARRLIQLVSTLSPSHLIYFPAHQLTQVRDTANAIFNTFQSFADFDVASAQPSVAEAQKQLVASLENQFQNSFNVFSPMVAFSSARSQDFSALERDARAAVQSAQDQATSIVGNLNTQKEAIEAILGEVRAAAAEQGVSKQAIHFKNEADQHGKQAGIWLVRSIGTAIGLGAFAVVSLFMHHFPGLDATDPYRMAQIAVSKVLIFGVIAYMLLLSARNFLSHKHNEVVNRHRQNALATFIALADAASDAASSDIILSHAASCIFSPQETGYTRQDSGSSDSISTLQLLPRVVQATQQTS